MERIVKAEVHRLIVVNADHTVCGIISLSDILTYVIIRPYKDAQRNSQRNSESSNNSINIDADIEQFAPPILS